jgi:hypothetical protein
MLTLAVVIAGRCRSIVEKLVLCTLFFSLSLSFSFAFFLIQNQAKLRDWNRGNRYEIFVFFSVFFVPSTACFCCVRACGVWIPDSDQDPHPEFDKKEKPGGVLRIRSLDSGQIGFRRRSIFAHLPDNSFQFPAFFLFTL